MLKYFLQQYMFQGQQNFNKKMEKDKDSGSILDERYAKEIKEFQSRYFTKAYVPDLIKAINSKDIIMKHYGFIGIRKIIHQYFSDVYRSNIAQSLIRHAKQSEYPHLQLEAMRIIVSMIQSTNIYPLLITSNVIPIFLELLKSSHEKIVEQALLAIIVFHKSHSNQRTLFINAGAVQHFIDLNARLKSKNLVTTYYSALCSTCSRPLPDRENIQAVVEILCNAVVRDFGEKDLFQSRLCYENIIKTISYHSKGKKNQQIIIKSGAAAKLISNVLSLNPAIEDSIWIIKDITTDSSEKVVDMLFTQEVIHKIEIKMNNSSLQIQRLLFSVICIIVSKSKFQASIMVKKLNILKKVIDSFRYASFHQKKELVIFFLDLVRKAPCYQLLKILEESKIFPICVQLLVKEQNLDKTAILLHSIYDIMIFGISFQKDNEDSFVIEQFKRATGRITLEKLAARKCQHIHNLVNMIMSICQM